MALQSRHDIIDLLDGTHPTASRRVAFALQGFIMVSALAIALETVPGLPDGVHAVLAAFEVVILCVFLVEYVTRLVCSPHPLKYAVSFWGLVDLLSWLPLLLILAPQVAALRLLRLVRVLKLLHTNRALVRLERALHDSRGDLAVFALLAAIVLYIAAVGIFIFEHEAQPEAFSSIPKSLWWAVVSFTTVGYGDIYPITPAGRIFTTAILFVGLGVIAVPTAIITTALINTDLRDRIEEEVEDDIRKDLKLDRSVRSRQPKRRK